MRVSEIMSRPVVTTSPQALLKDAVVLLTEGGYAGLPVVDDEERVLGIVTEADALRAMTGEIGTVRVADMMTAPVEVVSPVTDVTDIARIMLRDGLRSVPVVAEGVLVGIVSRRDVLRPFVRPDDTVGTHVRKVLADYDGHRDRWQVDVEGGVVTVSGDFSDSAEQHVVSTLVRTVPGVLSVDLRAR